MDLANQFLAPYNTKIHQLSFKPISLRQWHISSTELTVDETEVQISDIDILLDEKTQLWAFKVSDLAALSVAKVDVKLALSALTASPEDSGETGPTIALNFDAFPDIDLKQTHISIKGADSSAPSLELNGLSLSKHGELKSQIDVNHKPLLSLSAKLTPKRWSATTSVDLTLLQSFSRQLAATEKALHAKQTQISLSSQSEAQATSQKKIHSQNESLLAPLYRLTQAIDDRHISIEAKLDSQFTLNLKNAQLSSKHSLLGTRVTFNDFAKQTLQPINLGLGQKAQKEQEQLGRLNFEFGGHIASLELTVMPFKLVLALENSLAASDILDSSQKSDEQLRRILQRLNDKPFEQALFNLYKQLSPNAIAEENAKAKKTGQAKQKRPSLMLSLDDGLSYQIEQQNLSVPKLALFLEDSKLDAELLVSSLNYQPLESQTASTPTEPSSTTISTTNDYKLSANWQLKASHEQSLSLNKLWPKLSELAYQIEIGEASLGMQGGLTATQAKQLSHYRITIASGASQTSKAITLSNSAKVADNKTSPSQLNTHIGQTQLTLNSPFEYNYSQSQNQSQNQLTIPALRYRVTDLTGDLQLNNALEEHYKLQLDGIDFALQQAIPLMFKSRKAHAAHVKDDSSFVSQLLSHKLSNQIDLTLTQLSLDKSGYNRALHIQSSKANKHKRRQIKQKLAQFDTIELTQTLTLNHHRLDSDESWQINDLYLTSQHQFTPNLSDLSRFNLSGDWQFSSEFAPILAFLSQTDSLPNSLDIQGNAKLAMHYQLTRNQQLGFNLTLDPQVSNIQGSLNNLPFEGGNIDTQCQFNWQQDSANKRASAFNCDNIKLSLQAFNPGVLITDVNAEAAVSFATESNITEPADPVESQDKAKNLALAQQLLGVKQASVGLTARGNLLSGQLLIPKFQLNLRKPSSAYFVLQHISLKQLLAIHPQVGIYADGIFDGVLPVSIEKGKASISGGRLAARAPGGIIAIGNNPAVEQMRQSQPYLEFAFSALEHLNYSELSSSFDMNALGDAKLKVNIKGRSQGIERPIHFNYSQEENMIQLLRSLQIGDNLQEQIERAVK
ncbi:conserved hypothetical protein [Shewanella halifaxensis HAW-EB4]|uniref:Uncharacterized protein n=2 Tax=Shewanella halifaxensis TaxID=271098 RepID=B0TJJ9_SHEHH|nr:conserved hypothetical protein [Shewanella halifaxensis HAW-EB4]